MLTQTFARAGVSGGTWKDANHGVIVGSLRQSIRLYRILAGAYYVG